MLIPYTKENRNILEINKKDRYGMYPLLSAIERDEIEMVKLLMEYAKENNIILEVNKQCGYGDFYIVTCYIYK